MGEYERSKETDRGISNCRSVLFEPNGTPRGHLLFDIDYTVRNNAAEEIHYPPHGKSKVTARTKQNFGNARARGLGVSVATGQTLGQELSFLKTFAAVGGEPYALTELHSFFSGTSIFEDGGMYLDHQTGLYRFSISAEELQAIELVRQTIKNQFSNGALFGATAKEAPQPYMSQYQVWVEGVDYADYLAHIAMRTSQIVSVAQVRGLIDERVQLEVIDPVQDGSPTIRVAGVSKKRALEQLYDLNRVIFLCNDHNDVAAAKAVKTAGGGVICPNDAVREVQMLADYVATAGPDEGISEALEKILH